jgi:transcriptional repressor of dcmA and dcmR
MSDKLLNTAEAARFLRVSQASVRRWSDSGLLQARRVGRRRERRFTEADLATFLTPSRVGQTTHREPDQRGVFVGGTAVPIHGHIATFYASDQGRVRLPIPFLREGLKLRQPCFLAASGHVLDAYLEALRQDANADVDSAIRSGLFVIADGPGASVEEALGFWDRLLSRSLAGGPTLMRIVGEMTCERLIFPSDAEMIRYEVSFNDVAKRFPTVTLCQYDVREFPGETIFHALRAHPDLYDLRLAGFLN